MSDEPTPQLDEPSLLPWTLSFLRPYRRRVALLVGAARCPRSALGALQPWPLKIVIDNVLGSDASASRAVRGWLHGDSPAATCVVLLVVVVVAGVVLQVVNQFVVGVRHAGAGRHRPADGLRPARPAVPASAGARPAPSHHDQHRRRGLPRRRRRLRDREPGDERHLSAGDLGHRADGDVRHPAAAGPHDRAAVAGGRAVPVSLPALLHVDAGRIARSASRSSSRSCSSGSTRRSAAMRLVKSFAREPHELQRYATRRRRRR